MAFLLHLINFLVSWCSLYNWHVHQYHLILLINCGHSFLCINLGYFCVPPFRFHVSYWMAVFQSCAFIYRFHNHINEQLPFCIYVFISQTVPLTFPRFRSELMKICFIEIGNFLLLIYESLLEKSTLNVIALCYKIHLLYKYCQSNPFLWLLLSRVRYIRLSGVVQTG